MENTPANQANGIVWRISGAESVVVNIDRVTGKAYTSFPEIKFGIKMPDPRGARP